MSLRRTSARTSTAVRNISTDLIRGVALVTFNNGNRYRYTNVSRRAIANLQLNSNLSFGFWVNTNCINTDAPCERVALHLVSV